MNKKISILATGLLFFLGLTSCADQFDDPNIYNAFGNNTIKEQRTISIAELKNKHNEIISNNGYEPIDSATVIKGVIIADDESGNIYKQLIVADESGAITVSIDNTGLYAYTPVGQQVTIDCTGLWIGGYGEQGQIGIKYYNAEKKIFQIGRMPIYVWEKHVRLLNKPQIWYNELRPLQMTNGSELSTMDKDDQAPCLVKLIDVTIKGAEKGIVFAPDAEKDNGNGVTRTIVFNDKTTLDIRTSAYANFSTDSVPKGSMNITGILGRYRDNWQLTVRTLNDIEVNN